MKLQIINPVTHPRWDELVLAANDNSFFHSSGWAKVLCASYRYSPAYFTLSEQGRLVALLPVMEVSSALTGRRGVSLTFTDICEPIAEDRGIFHVLLEHVIEYAKQSGWGQIEFRGGQTFFSDAPVSASYLGHTLVLSGNEQDLFAGFRNSTRRNIQKAIREGVETTIDTSLQSVRDFYTLHCMSRKRYGLPPQPFHFFRNIYEYVISKNLGFVVLASYQKRNIAGAVYFHFGNKALYKFGASDEAYQHLRASNLVMWEAIKWYAHNGYGTFCFGRTDCENSGLRQFKNGWGTTEKTINYYTYSIKDGIFVDKKPTRTAPYTRLFQKMPEPILKMIGNIMYRHMG